MMKNRILVTTLLLTGLLFAGCSSSQSRKTEHSTIDPSDAHRIGYTVSWSSSLSIDKRALRRGRAGLVQASMIEGHLITVENPNNLVSSIDLRDGLLKWRHLVAAPTDSLSEPFSYNDRVLVNSETELYTLDARTGRLVQTAPLREVVHARAEVINNLAIYGGINGRIFAHDLKSNQPAWEYQMTAGIIVPPVNWAHTVFVADSNGVYASLLHEDGTLLFKGRTFSRISATPAVNILGAFVASEDQTLYALNANTGRDNWKYPAGRPLTESPTIFGNTLLLPIPGKGLRAIDARSGETIWESNISANPILLNESRLLMYDKNSIYVLDPPSGKVVMQVPVDNIYRILHIEDEKLLLITEAGIIMRLDPVR